VVVEDPAAGVAGAGLEPGPSATDHLGDDDGGEAAERLVQPGASALQVDQPSFAHPTGQRQRGEMPVELGDHVTAGLFTVVAHGHRSEELADGDGSLQVRASEVELATAQAMGVEP